MFLQKKFSGFKKKPDFQIYPRWEESTVAWTWRYRSPLFKLCSIVSYKFEKHELACTEREPKKEKKKTRVPHSIVHWSRFAILTCVTVGRVLFKDFKESAIFNGGSSNSSEPIWDHDLSTAFGSPGEQGHFFGSPFAVSGFATCLK